MARYVIPFRSPGAKTRLGDPALAQAMALDVAAACAEAGGGEPLVVTAPVGLNEAVTEALSALPPGPVTIVSADVPAATADELRALTAAAPALVAGRDGRTNGLALRDPADFRPLYGPGSAARFEAELGAARLGLPGLEDDVDVAADLPRVRGRLGARTAARLRRLVAA